MALKGAGVVNVGGGRRKRCDGGGRGVFGGAGLAARLVFGVGEGGEVRRRFGRGPGSKRSSVSLSSASSASGETCRYGSGAMAPLCPSLSSSDIPASSTDCNIPSSSPSSSSRARSGLDCDCDVSSMLSTRVNFRPAFARAACAVSVSPRSGAACGMPTWPARTGATTKRFAGVTFLNRSGSELPGFGVRALMAWRRLDFGFGLGVWVDGGAAGAMKRCGEGFCGGILGETWVFEGGV